MKLKDVADMEDYLENRCYCPGEIYYNNKVFINTGSTAPGAGTAYVSLFYTK